MAKPGKKTSKKEVAARGAMIGAAAGGVTGLALTPAASVVGTAVGGYVGSKVAPHVAGVETPPAPWEMVLDARLLWERYFQNPTKKNLLEVEKHCHKMAQSKSKTVKKERQRCMSAVRAEKKRLGLK